MYRNEGTVEVISDFLYYPSKIKAAEIEKKRKDIVALVPPALASALNGQNEAYIEEELNLHAYYYDLHMAWKNTAAKEEDRSSILKEKLDRCEKFKDLLVNFTLELINMLYWIDPTVYEKSNIGVMKSCEFAISISKKIASEFSKRLDEEYDLSRMIEMEFGKNMEKRKLY